MTSRPDATRSHRRLRAVPAVLAVIVLVLTAVTVPLPGRAEAAGRVMTGLGLDPVFRDGFGTGFDRRVRAMVPTPDGGVLVGGDFSALDGDDTVPKGLVKFTADGELDGTFNANLGSGILGTGVYGIHVATVDGETVYYVGGAFTAVNGLRSGGIARLRADGSVDAEFGANTGAGSGGQAIVSFAVDADGGVLAGGQFSAFNGTPVGNVVKVDADGVIDRDFQAALGSGFNAIVSAIEALPDGRFLVGGQFTQLNGAPVGYAVWFAASGELDAAGNAAWGSGVNRRVLDIEFDPERGYVYLSGGFTQINGTSAGQVARLRPDGSADTEFATALGAGAAGGEVLSVGVDPDGSVVLGGTFTTLDGVVSGKLGRLTPTGAVDAQFSRDLGAGFGGAEVTEVVSTSGGVWTGGSFQTLDGGHVPQHLFRLLNITMDSSGVADRSDPEGVEIDVVLPVAVVPENAAEYTVTGLPDGLTVDSRTGRVTGTPTRPGDFEVQLDVACQPIGPSTSESFVWSILDAPRVAGSPPPAPVGTYYTYTFALGGDPMPTTSVTDLGQLPPGMSLRPGGLLSGTPTVAGEFEFTVVASNGVGPDASLVVSMVVTQDVVLSGVPGDGVVGSGYEFAFAVGGYPVPEVSVSDPVGVPPGLSLSGAGVLSGVPTVAGEFEFTVVASNGVGSDASVVVSMVVTQDVVLSGVPGDGVVGSGYEFAFAVGGYPVPEVSVSDPLGVPPGLSLSGAGVLSGVPTVAGEFEFTVVASNGVGPDASVVVSMVVTQDVVLSGVPGDGVVGSGYEFAFAVGGYPVPEVSVSDPLGVPPGLSLSGAGVLSGVPTVAGEFEFTVVASNGVGSDASVVVSMVVTQDVVLSGVPGDGVVGSGYEFAFAVGGYPVPEVSVSDPLGVPPGLSLSGAGVLSGVPTVAGEFEFTVVASNGVGPDASLVVSMVVAGEAWLGLEHDQLAPGDVQTVSGGGYVPGEQVDLTLASVVVSLGSVTADGAGGVRFEFVVPEDSEPGVHTVTGTGESGLVASDTFTVLAAEGPDGPSAPVDTEEPAESGEPDVPDGELAWTGSALGALALLAAGLVLAGVVLVRGRRESERRR